MINPETISGVFVAAACIWLIYGLMLMHEHLAHMPLRRRKLIAEIESLKRLHQPVLKLDPPSPRPKFDRENNK